jgi:hypothetical protein
MILAWLLLLTGLTISAVAIYYSVVGLTAIFSAAVIPIIIMGSALEVGKLVCASWLKENWERAPRFMKYYMISAVMVLMLITSMGIFGFLSKAHNDQNLVSGDVQSKIAIYDEKIKTARENIEADRKQLKQMDEAVDQIMGRSQDEKGADKANAVRKSQQRDRSSLAKDIEANQKQIASLNDEAAPIRAEVRKVEAEVGPIKYIAKFIYGEHGADENMLEKAVTWIIVLIVVVFDPLAVIMLLAAQMTFGWTRERKEQEAEGNSLTTESEDNIIIGPTVTELDNATVEPLKEKVKETIIDFEGVREPGGEWIQTGPEFEVAKQDVQITETIKDSELLASSSVEIDSSTVEERLATGESYIDSQGNETHVEEAPVTEDSKKKTYMIKDQTGKMQVKNTET